MGPAQAPRPQKLKGLSLPLCLLDFLAWCKTSLAGPHTQPGICELFFSMTLRLYNTLSRQLEDFKPMAHPRVGMYVCGMTVYDHCHIGHARSMVAFDVIKRWLDASGYVVNYVRNITDIDDKIIRRAFENGESIRALTDRMILALQEDCSRLNIQAPNAQPRATDYVPQMMDFIRVLMDKGLAYKAGDDVNFAVRRFLPYGQLSGKSLDELHAGERVAVLAGKEDPLDFVLWKGGKVDEPEEAKWQAPFGLGRPGWHIECSAMACELLGQTFDIHGGGADLQFPHHENEIAQSVGAHGVPLAQYWMHNGFVNIDNEKMSKSLGNFFTIREVLEHCHPETLRFFIARSHYRSALNYSDVHLDDAHGALKRLYTALALASPEELQLSDVDWTDAYAARFKAAMDEDFATPEAVAVLFDLAGEVNRTGSSARAGLLKVLGAVLGILQLNPTAFLQSGAKLQSSDIEAQIFERASAKAAKNFSLADEIRQSLLAQGIVLKDSASGTTWEQQS